MGVVGFAKPEEEPLDLNYDDEIMVRQWCLEQAIIICGYGTPNESGRDLRGEAMKLYDFVISKKVT